MMNVVNADKNIFPRLEAAAMDGRLAIFKEIIESYKHNFNDVKNGLLYYMAARSGNMEILRYLKDNNALLAEKYIMETLEVSVRADEIEAVEFLLESIYTLTTENEEKLLAMACEYDYIDMAKLLVTSLPHALINDTALRDVARKENVHLYKILLPHCDKPIMEGSVIDSILINLDDIDVDYETIGRLIDNDVVSRVLISKASGALTFNPAAGNIL